MLRPARGVLPHAATDTIRYDVNAPEGEGCVATLVRVRREQGAGGGAGGGGGGGGGGGARAALVAYRVLAPRLVLRLLSCALTASHHDGQCGRRSCYLYLFTHSHFSTVILRDYIRYNTHRIAT
ncbi:hypothetical protein HF086_013489 [Spodoptera exigua]|uniref:Uncharacterized protein n=1 Tax=Spodoptera exigua TaxID=7107 RepID=A0A922SB51_SPOEX|nr:hypothetical protein HF086_013489 [Spodoptera exigua]